MVETKKEVDQTEVFHLEKVLHPQLHPAWLYFDKGYADYLRADDVEVMLHNLGVFLSAKQVEQLVSWSSSVTPPSAPSCHTLPACRPNVASTRSLQAPAAITCCGTLPRAPLPVH